MKRNIAYFLSAERIDEKFCIVNGTKEKKNAHHFTVIGEKTHLNRDLIRQVRRFSGSSNNLGGKNTFLYRYFSPNTHPFPRENDKGGCDSIATILDHSPEKKYNPKCLNDSICLVCKGVHYRQESSKQFN